MKKGIRNADTVARKLRPALTRTTNDRLKAVKEEKQKREQIIEKQKAKTMAVKWHRARGGISLSNEEKDETDIKDDTNLD